MKEMMISKPIDLKGRNALVTGGARGIGAATALVLAREGASVAIGDKISSQDTVKGIEALGRRAVGIKADIAYSSDVKRMVEEALDALGHIDILINNAGEVHRDSLMETTEEVWDRIIDVDLKGAFLCIQAIYPHMKERGYGKIVNISSISGIIGGAVSKAGDSSEALKGRSGPAYTAAKGGVIALTRWIAKDIAKDGIYVNCIAPGGTNTEMTRGYDYNMTALPIPRMGEPEDIAEAVLFLSSGASNYITGQVLNVDGGWVMA